MSHRKLFSRLEKECLNTMRVGRMATVETHSKYPHIVPICFVFDGNLFYTTLSKDSRRVRNIESGSNASILVDKYEEANGKWLTLQGLLIKCKVSLYSYYENKERFMKGWTLLIRKYPQYEQWADEDMSPKDPEKRLIMQMKPINKISWGFIS